MMNHLMSYDVPICTKVSLLHTIKHKLEEKREETSHDILMPTKHNWIPDVKCAYQLIQSNWSFNTNYDAQFYWFFSPINWENDSLV